MNRTLAAIGLAALAIVFGTPLLGWPPVVRLPAVLVPALALAVLVTRPWRGHDLHVRALDWQPSRRLVCSAAFLVGLLLFWYVLTRFRSGEINAIDFTVYYDRPCFQTVSGRPLFVETSNTPGFSNRTELADHAYWGMPLLCAPYAVYPSPLWLHAISAIAIVVGAVQVLRILQHLGAGGVLASATSLAFVLNDNTARTLNYGFHPEVLYACFIPWMIHAGLRRDRRSFLAATLACVMVKEDACFPVFAASVALALCRFRVMSGADRLVFLLLPPAVALINLGIYYGYVVPALTGENRPTYAHFWANYGQTPMLALLGILSHPGRVFADVMSSGIVKVLKPHLFLPLLGWRWAVGAVPIVVLYGASANDQVRAFGIYYAIVLVPFLVVAASAGALALARRFTASDGRAQLAAGGAVLCGALFVGSGDRGYSLRPWKEELAAVPAALADLRDEGLVLVQSGLYTHAGYDERVKMLTPETLQDARRQGAALLLARGIDGYPFRRDEIATLCRRWSAQVIPGGMDVVRLTPREERRQRHHGRRGKRARRVAPEGGRD